MTRLSWLIAGLTAFASVARADIQLGALSQSYDALTDTITLKFDDDGTAPPLKEYTLIQVNIMTGPNDNIKPVLLAAVPQTAITGLSSIAVPLAGVVDIGNDGSYYLQVQTLVTAAEFSLHYSDRFDLTGMSGTTIKASSGGDTTPPEPLLLSVPEPPGAASSLAAVPYTEQVSRTRYAPMQLQPGTTVTKALSPSPRFPTSAVSYFKTAEPSPSQWSTITMGWSYTFSSLTNYASTMPAPTVFYKATAVIASSIEAKSQAKARRWDK